MSIRILPASQTLRIDDLDHVVSSAQTDVESIVSFTDATFMHLRVAKEEITSRLRLAQLELINTTVYLSTQRCAVDLHVEILLSISNDGLELHGFFHLRNPANRAAVFQPPFELDCANTGCW